jgi:PleD family two-component response regulator
MNAKPLKLLLLEDGRKDARFLQKAIADGGSFECDLVRIDELEHALSERTEEPPILLLRSADSSSRLSSDLKRIREIASNVPVLVLPNKQDGLVHPGAAAGDSAKSNGHHRLNLKKLARILRCGLRQTQLESELSHLAISDELTGLYNRRGFLLLGSERMKLAHSMKKNVLLFFADLDNLKQINDQYGHQEVIRLYSKPRTSSEIHSAIPISPGASAATSSPPWSSRILGTLPTPSQSACKTTWRNSPPTTLITLSR